MWETPRMRPSESGRTSRKLAINNTTAADRGADKMPVPIQTQTGGNSGESEGGFDFKKLASAVGTIGGKTGLIPMPFAMGLQLFGGADPLQLLSGGIQGMLGGGGPPQGPVNPFTGEPLSAGGGQGPGPLPPPMLAGPPQTMADTPMDPMMMAPPGGPSAPVNPFAPQPWT